MESVYKEGFLYKKAELGLKKSWKRRYFRLFGDAKKLSYSHTEKDSEIGYIDLSDASNVMLGGLSSERNRKNLHSFRIQTRNRLWLLRAETLKDAKDWISAIEKFLSKRPTSTSGVESSNSRNSSANSSPNISGSQPSSPAVFKNLSIRRAADSKRTQFFEEKKKIIQGKVKLKAKFNYEGTEPNDLSFKEGDIITLIEEIDQDDLKGELNGVVGIFPRTFVRPLDEEEEKLQLQQMLEKEWEKQLKLEEINDSQGSIFSTSQKTSLRFSQTLLFDFEGVILRTENGVQVCKDLIDFFKKRSQIEEEYSKKLSHLCKSVPGTSLFNKDQALLKESKTLQEVFHSLLQAEIQQAQHRLDFSQQLNKDLVKPLESWIKPKEIERKKLALIGQNYVKIVADAKNIALKNREIYEKSLREQEALRSEITKGEEEEKKLNKLSTKLTQLQEKTKALEQNFKNSVSKANEEIDKFEKEHMPSIIDKLQKWEENRWNKLLGSAVRLQQLLEPFPIQFGSSLKLSAAAIESANLELDMKEFINATKTGTKNERLSAELPPSPAFIASSSTNYSPNHSQSPHTSRGVTLNRDSNPPVAISLNLNTDEVEDNLIQQILLVDNSTPNLTIQMEENQPNSSEKEKVSSKDPTEILNEGLDNILKYLETVQTELG